MANGISKGIGEQLGELGKQVATDIAKTPAKIVGLDETVGQGTGGKGQKPPPIKKRNLIEELVGKPRTPEELEQLKVQQKADDQKKIAMARRLLQNISQPASQGPSRQEQEMAEMEKQRAAIEKQRKQLNSSLPQVSSKPKRGNLYGVKQKKFGGELGKNVKSG